MECLKVWIEKLKSMMKIGKPNVPKSYMQKKYYLNFLNKYFIFFEIERNHKVEYDYDNKLCFPK
jgi:hypothetical protein